MRVVADLEVADAMRSQIGRLPDLSDLMAMRMIAASEKDEEDIVASLEEFEIVVDPGSAKNLDGAILDYDDGVLSGSFKFDNGSLRRARPSGVHSRRSTRRESVAPWR